MNDEHNERPDDSDGIEHTRPLLPEEPGSASSHEASGPPSYAPPSGPPSGPTSQAPGPQAAGQQPPPGPQAQPPNGPASQVPGQQPQQPHRAQQPPNGPAAQAPGRQPAPGPQSPAGHPGQQGSQWTQGPQSPGHPAYAASAGRPTGPQGKPPKQLTKTPSGVWPAVAAMSLVIGLVGGGLGGYAVNQWTDDEPDSQSSSQGLADDDVVTTPPLPSNAPTSDKGSASKGSIAAVAEVLLPSTVQIIADYDGEEGGATGSGFYLDKQGHVVTNNHVVADAADGGKITVVDHQGKRYSAKVVGRSPVYDLAVLDVEGVKDIQPASLGSSKSLKVGEQVVAIGSPLGLSSTVTSGIVSALNRPVTTGGDADSQSFINAVQTDAAINPGNSGGPLVNLSGQVVGVNSAIATTGGSSLGGESGNIGVGFAIPIEQVRVTADQILENGEARYPVIGATVKSDPDGAGAQIDSVVSDSPADDSGLEKGDLITALDDRAVTDNATLIVAIRSHLPGDTVTLTVDRDGETKKFDVELDSKVG